MPLLPVQLEEAKGNQLVEAAVGGSQTLMARDDSSIGQHMDRLTLPVAGDAGDKLFEYVGGEIADEFVLAGMLAKVGDAAAFDEAWWGI